MTSRFATVSKYEILAINEAAAPTITIWLVGVYWLVEKKSSTELATNHKKMIPETLSIET